MSTVQPIRDEQMLQRFYRIAIDHDRHRRGGEVSWELLLLVGFNTSLRISDLRRLRVADLRGREFVQIRAQKTGKDARILINPWARREINRLLEGRGPDEFVFQSVMPDYATHKAKAITRQRAWQIIREIARRAGFEEKIGCHTLRKTFGFHYYKRTGDVVSLQRILCHSAQRETLIYIGIEQQAIDESLREFGQMLVPGRAAKA